MHLEGSPENKNIRIEDKNDKLIQIWKDNKWIYKNRNKLIDNIIFAKYAILGDILAEIHPIVFRFNKTYLASQTYFLLYANPQKGNIFKILDANKVKK